MAKVTKLSPFICLDNLDMQERVHYTRLDAATKTFHGTWGYIHDLESLLLDKLDTAACSAERIRELFKADAEKVVEPAEFHPTKSQQKHWKRVLKGQPAQVLFRYVKNPTRVNKSRFLNLPAIDQIKCQKPSIYMLKLMDSSDNGSAGVGQLLQELMYQTGLTAKQIAQRLQVLEGDLGTCLNLDGLQKLRDPTNIIEESLYNYLLIPGAGHTLWNIAQALLLHHWGDPSDREDMGVWRMVVALGGKKEAPTAKKDFTSMLRWIEKVHEASILHCIL